MAEVSGAFSQEELLTLKDQATAACDRVIRKNHSLPPLKTAKGNLIIRDYCFDRICEVVERVWMKGNYRDLSRWRIRYLNFHLSQILRQFKTRVADIYSVKQIYWIRTNSNMCKFCTYSTNVKVLLQVFSLYINFMKQLRYLCKKRAAKRFYS